MSFLSFLSHKIVTGRADSLYVAFNKLVVVDKKVSQSVCTDLWFILGAAYIREITIRAALHHSGGRCTVLSQVPSLL